MLEYSNGYRGSACPCKEAEYKQTRKQRVLDSLTATKETEAARLNKSKKASATYTWLGYDYSVLEQRELRSFERELQPEAFGVILDYAARAIDREKDLDNILIYGLKGLGKTHL